MRVLSLRWNDVWARFRLHDCDDRIPNSTTPLFCPIDLSQRWVNTTQNPIYYLNQVDRSQPREISCCYFASNVLPTVVSKLFRYRFDQISILSTEVSQGRTPHAFHSRTRYSRPRSRRGKVHFKFKSIQKMTDDKM